MRGLAHPLAALVLLFLLSARPAGAAPLERLDADAKAGRPLVVHVVVALADNAHQGIVPVPARLGDGRDARANLYWGAAYGVKTFFSRAAGWSKRTATDPLPEGVLDRAVFVRDAKRAGAATKLFVVAEAWDGAKIREGIVAFLDHAAGAAPRTVHLTSGEALEAGGRAHVVAFVGHDGLMDFRVPAPVPDPAAPQREAIVLACISRSYFGPHLAAAGADPLVLTTGLMAPEGYVLEAALSALATGGDGPAAREAAARAYDHFQKCGLRGARRLFSAAPK
jgi:hypothetical protein